MNVSTTSVQIKGVKNKSGKEKSIKELVEEKISGNKVMIFSKPNCTHCSSAKKTIEKYTGKSGYAVWEISKEVKCRQIQAILRQKTGASTVPRVFINGKSVGGCNDTHRLHEQGKLKDMIKMD